MSDRPDPDRPDCEPDWNNDPNAAPPTRFDLRQHEMRDLRHQHAGPAALWTADTVPTEEYL